MREELGLLSQCLADEIYKVLKVNLLTDTYEVIKNTNPEPGRRPGDTGCFSEWIREFSAQKLVHPDEEARYLWGTDVKKIREHFALGNKKWSIWYRRMIQDEYRWVVMKMITTPNYSEENPEVILYVQDDQSDENFDLNAATLNQQSYLRALAKVYTTLHIIDLEKNRFAEYSCDPIVRGFLDSVNPADMQMRRVMRGTICAEDLERILEFTELTTLAERMLNRDVIYTEAIGIHFGWVRAQFIVIDRDAEGLPTSVFFSTRIIDMEKKREEMLRRASQTDGLTGILNRLCFEEDVKELDREKLPEDIMFISMDVNGLKDVNDKFGHQAGDELLRSAATCMEEVFGDYGKIYRIGGDEFAAILHVEKDRVSELLGEFETKTTGFKGQWIDGISISVGKITVWEFQGATLSELSKIADGRMYNAKTEYYRARGIDRRYQ